MKLLAKRTGVIHIYEREDVLEGQTVVCVDVVSGERLRGVAVSDENMKKALRHMAAQLGIEKENADVQKPD